MSNLQQIKKRIRSLDTTKKITHAMKHVSTVRFRRSQRMLIAARPYSEQLANLLSRLSSGQKGAVCHPFLEQVEPKNAMVVIITSDRGMCGAFNANLIKTAEQFIREKQAAGITTQLALIGRKGYDHFRTNGYDLLHNYPGVFDDLTYLQATNIASGFEQSFIKHDMDSLFIIYHEFRSMSHQEVVIKQLLPILPAAEDNEDTQQYIYEPGQSQLLEKLAPHYLAFQIWRVLLESSASEHAARMTAMEAAAHNEAEMRQQLLLSYNRARQESVTTELLDIISGANALS